MKPLTRFFTLSLFVLLSTSLVSAQDLDERIQKAEAVIAEYAKAQNVPGMSISIYKGNKMVLSKGYGYADVTAKKPVDPATTLFRIGSVSKTLTAAGMGVLIQSGELDPKEEIHTYVPDFPKKKYPMTVQQVAGHIAGIRHYRGDEFMSAKSYPTVTEGLDIFKDDPLLFEPQTSYQYSSYGWNLISAVMEGASGEEFLNFMEHRVFGALGMDNTLAEWANKELPNKTKFYVYRDGKNIEAPFVDNSYKWAGGGFIGTTEDLVTFGVAHFDYDYLNEETHSVLMTPQYMTDGKSTNYGMGWRTYTDNQNRVWLGHSGGSVGGSTMFLINKKEKMVIAYTINRSSVNFDNLHFKLADIFLN
ncbi:serine hydrolase domain-containing protein [Balneola vulgaris]|uniref:serine hydrolase domain-containing protein n=1 Tax=Balneola vulgaris TaxID=287535 RepID=UPI0003782A69|nr:serine hydrolase domain-containing protein [Balneola vulgaris]